MTELLKTNREPFFLDCDGRRLFSIYHAPEDAASLHSGTVYFPPFAEEANRTRRMASLLGENLSATGTGTLLFDYSSTGDSSGDFSEASWDNWVADGCAAIDWLHNKTKKPVSVVGLRLGAILALECARKVGIEVPNIVLWQPATNGRTLFTQFLRIRLASSLAEGGEKETTKGLMQRLTNGETLEVAGYNISPALAGALDQVKIADLEPSKTARIHWLEISTDDEKELMPPSQMVIAKWRDAGVTVEPSVISGEQFWATQEIATNPALIEATNTVLTGVSAWAA